ncbi:2-oxoglutarate-Fe(II)-dependent oxygenase superfamily protein [Variovorax beijingensis]|uniref:procollagen-proline 3-dioxygenase n=1 Tax=Variovorax beijingensis TaxID=2496117 RepID=A0A561C427_9BURK|nr:2OG-Fe(II) oxygenase [Variovorax beijingensis]TWD85757.1 2-oxoglutarate-Fe(II)-dependent oxygenase superfamily protein [Variovorax beijingensis]
MITYAESIQKPDAAIFQRACSLSVDLCVSHIERQLVANEYRVHEVYGRDGGSIVDTRYRDSKAIVPRHDEELAFYIYEVVHQYFLENFSAQPCDSLVLAQTEFFAYSAGVGLKMHADDHALGADGRVLKRDVQRGITAILYLNSEFDGGEIHFPKQDLELRPSAGTLVVFPSNRNFPHEVKPILRGQRYSYQRIYGILNGRAESFLAENEAFGRDGFVITRF